MTSRPRPATRPRPHRHWLDRHTTSALTYNTFRLEELHPPAYGDTAVVTARQIAEGTYQRHPHRSRDPWRGWRPSKHSIVHQARDPSEGSVDNLERGHDLGLNAQVGLDSVSGPTLGVDA